TVDLPDPDSPARPNTSPRRISKSTPSTALTAGGSPRLKSEARNPVRRGKCFLTPRTSTSGVGSSAGAVPAACPTRVSGTDGHLLRMRVMEPARHPAVLGRPFGPFEGRLVDRADLFHHVRAAGMEPTTRGR